MSNSKLIQPLVIIVFVSIFAVAGYFVWRSVSGSLDTRLRVNRSRVSNPETNGTVVGEEQTYTHPDYGFTLKYPGGYTLGRFPEGEGEVVLIQGKNSGEGFQIFISPYDETEEFSKEVILKADPKMKIENEKTISLGTEGLSALSFDSSGDTGATHEVWFVADGNLYQCTSFKNFGGRMEDILQSVRFN
jgi:hypothetical protein